MWWLCYFCPRPGRACWPPSTISTARCSDGSAHGEDENRHLSRGFSRCRVKVVGVTTEYLIKKNSTRCPSPWPITKPFKPHGYRDFCISLCLCVCALSFIWQSKRSLGSLHPPQQNATGMGPKNAYVAHSTPGIHVKHPLPSRRSDPSLSVLLVPKATATTIDCGGENDCVCGSQKAPETVNQSWQGCRRRLASLGAIRWTLSATNK